MNFFTLYKFELKKILFMFFAAAFIMYFSSVIFFNQNLNDAFLGYIHYRDLGNFSIHSCIYVLNFVWIGLMAFLQFYNYNFKERGNLPFNKNKLFLSTILSGVTIIAFSILFYLVTAGISYIKYYFVFEETANILSYTDVKYIYGFGFFIFSGFLVFLIMTAVYLTAVIFIFSFKNPIIASILWGGWNILSIYIAGIKEENVIFNYLNPLSWLEFNYGRPYIENMTIVSGVKILNNSFRALAVLYFVSAIFMLYIFAVGIFSRTENTTKNIFAKSKLGEFFIFSDTAMFVFAVLYRNLCYIENNQNFKVILITIISVLFGAAAVFITKALSKGVKRK